MPADQSQRARGSSQPHHGLLWGRLMCPYAGETKDVRRRRSSAPVKPNPMIIRLQVAGSGTGASGTAEPTIEPPGMKRRRGPQL